GIDIRGVDQRRSDHAADGGNGRKRRAAPGMQRAAGRGRLDDLLGGERKKKDHADVVDGELERVSEGTVAPGLRVGPDERGRRPDWQQQGVFDNRVGDAAIAVEERATHLLAFLIASMYSWWQCEQAS